MKKNNEKFEDVILTNELDVNQKKENINWTRTVLASLTIIILAVVTIVIMYAARIAKQA